MLRVSWLYAVSGFVSLGYQVAWFRIVADWFGSTNLTFALVVCSFIGGLSLGAMASERLSTWLSRRLGLRDRLRVYGWLEIAVSCAILLTPLAQRLPADLWGAFPYSLHGEIWVPTAAYRLSQVAIAALCVLVPCIFMGATFPLLCSAFLGEPRGERFPAALYASNTLGACLGVLACQFVFLLWLGHVRTLWLMAAVNLLLGLYFALRGGAPASAQPADAPLPPPGAEPKTDATASGVLLACAILSGFLAGALEGDLFKRISFLISVNPGATMTFISFWAIVGIFGASVLVHRSARLTLSGIKLGFGLALVCYLVAWRLRDTIIYPTLFHSTPAQLLVSTGIYVLPPFFLISFLLPYACNRLQSRGRHLGLAYGLNTAAFCLGLIGFSLIAPMVNVFFSLKLFMWTFGLCCVLLATLSEEGPLAAWKPASAVAGFALAILATPAEFDRSYFPPDSPPATRPVSALKSNGATTTFRAGRNLYFDRMSMSATTPAAQVYQRLMAHFPLLAHPHPRKALLICFGVGNTASAIAAHDTIEQLDAVDLNDKIFETAPEFAKWNARVYEDERIRMIHDDGRDFLNRTDEVYDLITSEPPPPLAAGVYRLYSREYYQAVLDHLSPDGLMSQWLPIGQMPMRARELAVRTFLDAFPYALLLRAIDQEFILVGSRAPIHLKRLADRFSESPTAVADLEAIGIGAPAGLWSRIYYKDDELRSLYPDGRLLSDQRNDFEHILGP